MAENDGKKPDPTSPIAEGQGATVPEVAGLVGYIKQCFQRAQHERLLKEQKWLTAYRNYRGFYDPKVGFDKDQCKIFVKITKTKTVAAYGQIIDVLFGTNKFPITIEPTEKPIGIAEYAHVDLNNPQAQQPTSDQNEDDESLGQTGQPTTFDLVGFPGDGKDLEPGATHHSLLGGLQDKYQGIPFEKGPAMDKQKEIQIKPAEEAAREMQKTIYDQLDETDAANALRSCVFEMVLLGTGIIKGPFNYKKVYHNWEKDPNTGERNYKPVIKLTPKLEYVSMWNFYPDPVAQNIWDAAWVIERHKYSATQMRDLMNRPYFIKDSLRRVLERGPNYERLHFEWYLAGQTDQQSTQKSRYEVLEYWGVVDRFLLNQMGFHDADVDDLDEVQVNVWVCNNEVIRIMINPFTPARIPYFACPYEIDPYTIWGIGVPENMEDSQDMMNGHARMAVDNLKLAGNVIFDIDETMLVAGQDYKIYPGKIFRRQGGQPGQAVFGVKIPDTSQSNMMIFDKFRQLADEETGMPSYAQGQPGVTGTTRTAAGMSMLMGAAALNIKTVIKNLDDYLLRPLGESMFQWNMQFNEDDLDIRGDLEVRARGTNSLMQKEVRSQRLTMLMNVASNPHLAPFVKWHTVLEEFAESIDMDPEDIIADPEEAALYAKIVGMQNVTRNGEGAPGAGQPSPMGGAPGVGGGPSPNDTSGGGGGQIGVGSAPQPGETGFSAGASGLPGAGPQGSPQGQGG